MDHEEASMAGATEKYLLGTLDEAQRDAFEEHFFECLECAEDVRAAAAVVAGARALPNGHVVSLSERRVAAEARRKRPVPGRRHLVTALGSLAAALVCLVGYQNLAVIPRMQAELRTAESIQPVSSHFLTLSRSEAPRVVVGPADRHVALTLSRSWDRPFPAYRCQLQDASGRVLLAQTLAARSAADELELLLPVGKLPAGSYVLVVEGVEGAAPARGSSAASAPVARYSFNLERR